MSILFDSQKFFDLTHVPANQRYSLPCYSKEYYTYNPFVQALLRLEPSSTKKRTETTGAVHMPKKMSPLLVSGSSSHKRSRPSPDDGRQMRRCATAFMNDIGISPESPDANDIGKATTSPLKKTKIVTDLNEENISEIIKSSKNTIKNSGLIQNCNSISSVSPRMDLHETETQYQISISLPGGSKDHIRIDFIKNSNSLIVSGKIPNIDEKEVTLSNKNNDGFFINEIRHFGDFKRVIKLEENIIVDSKSMKAFFENGILYIVLNKSIQLQKEEDYEALEIASEQTQDVAVNETEAEEASEFVIQSETKQSPSKYAEKTIETPKVRRITVEFD